MSLLGCLYSFHLCEIKPLLKKLSVSPDKLSSHDLNLESLILTGYGLSDTQELWPVLENVLWIIKEKKPHNEDLGKLLAQKSR